MHHTIFIRYDTADPLQADAEAIRDVIEYVGRDNWYKLFGFIFDSDADHTRYAMAKQWLQAFGIACSFAGIQGRPARALRRAFVARFPNDVMTGK